MLRESVLPTLISYLPEYMKGLRFETIDLGNMVCTGCNHDWIND
jgi:hypothetical protein